MTIKEIRQALHGFDDQLRVQEGVYYEPYILMDGTTMFIPTHNWRVERKVQKEIIVTQKPGELTHAEFHEVQDPNDRYSAQEGYLFVFSFLPNQCDWRIFYTIIMLDAQRMDSAVNEQEQRIAHRNARSQLAFADMAKYETREACRYMNTVRTVSEKHAHTAPPGGMSIMGD